MRRCAQCEQEKTESEFPASKWKQSPQHRVCLECGDEKRCSSCSATGGRKKFTPEEWAKADSTRRCQDCVPRRCVQCWQRKVRGKFSVQQWAAGEGVAVCYDCDRRRCEVCHKPKGRNAFTPKMWELPEGAPERCCLECTRGRRTRGLWVCRRCQRQKPITEFTKIIATKGQGVKGNSRLCNECVDKFHAEQAEQSRRTAEQVQKRRRR